MSKQIYKKEDAISHGMSVEGYSSKWFAEKGIKLQIRKVISLKGKIQIQASYVVTGNAQEKK